MDKPKITPYNLDLFSAPVTDIYRALETEIFTLVAKRLKTKSTHDRDYVLQWQIEKMNELKMLNKETIKALAKATGLSEQAIIQAINDVGYKTMQTVDDELKILRKPLPPTNHIDNILKSFVSQTFREIDNFVNQTLITTNYGEGTVMKMYRRIVEETTAKVLAGTTTINKALVETVVKWSDKGIETAFIDKGGHVWSLERYADTVIRSTVNRTYNEVRMSRMDDYGVDLVLISSHPAPRVACAPIQGRVASIKRPHENNSNYPSIYEFGYGEPDGLRGINCKHMFYPFVEGLNVNNQIQYTEEEMTRNRELEQKQRYLERQVRKAKRALMIAEEIGDEETIRQYKTLVRNRQTALREFVNEHNLVRRYDKERVIVVSDKAESIAKMKAEIAERNKKEKISKQIQEDIKSGKYNLKYNKQHYEKHDPNHKRYEDYVERNLAKGKPKPSYLTITYDEAQELVEKYAGTGKILLNKDNSFKNREVIVTDKIIGVHVNQTTGKETPTKAFKIHYSKKGVHIVPTLIDEED